MNINELDELAKSVTGWSNCDKAWLDTSEDTPAAVFGSIDEDGNTYPVAIVDCEQYFAASDSLKLAKFYAATNPSAVLELIAAYRESVAALYTLTQYAPAEVECNNMHHKKLDQHRYDETCPVVVRYATALYDAQETLATAKRLGVE